MNRSLNVFFGVLVCVGLIVGLFLWTKRSMSDSDKLNPYDFYNSVAGATYSVGGSGGVGMADGGLTVPMHGGRSMFRYRGASSYAPAYTAPNSLIASSPYRLDASASPLYATSSATMKSFGGGNAMGGSVSMSGGAVSSSPNSPIASSPSGLLASSPNSLIASSPITSSPSFSFYGTQTMGTEVYSGAGIYAGIGNTTNGSRGIRGRRGIGSMGGAEDTEDDGFGDSWLSWLARYAAQNGSTNGSYGFNIYQLQSAYDAWLQDWLLRSGLTKEDAPSFDDFLACFWGSENGHSYTWTDPNGDDQNILMHWVPVGDILPLLLIMLLYALVIFIKSNKSQGLTSNYGVI